MVRLVLLRLLESFFRHRWLNLLPVVVMSMLAVVFIWRSPPTYVAGGALFVQSDTLLSTLVPIGNSGGFSWNTPATITANEIRELMQTEAFVSFAIQRTPLEEHMQDGPEAVEQTIQQFRQSIWINELGEKLVGFSARHEDPEMAYQIATATIEAYSEWKLNSERQDSLVAQAFFAEQLVPYQQALDQARLELRTYLDAHPAPVRGERSETEIAEISRLQAVVEEASLRVKETVAREEEARLALSKAESEASRSYAIIDAPKVPTESVVSLKDMLIDAMIFVILGIGLSVGLVVGSMLLDRSLRFPIDVVNGLNLPLLAMVPVIRVSVPQPVTAEERQFLQLKMMDLSSLDRMDIHEHLEDSEPDQTPMELSENPDTSRAEDILAQPAHTSERILLPQSV